jgi:hypothetical protein
MSAALHLLMTVRPSHFEKILWIYDAGASTIQNRLANVSDAFINTTKLCILPTQGISVRRTSLATNVHSSTKQHKLIGPCNVSCDVAIESVYVICFE